MQDENDMIDDAESNRSDDTALEDEPAAGGAHTAENGDRMSEESAPEAASAADVGRKQDEPEVAAVETDGDEASGEEVSSIGVEEEEIEAEEEAAEAAEPAARAKPAAARKPEPPPEPEEIKMDWYILKVQSNRE